METVKRFSLLDSLRGIAVLSMIFYHFAWDIINIAQMPLFSFDSLLCELWQLSICVTFILISGFCFKLSRRPIKNALILLVSGSVVTVVTLVAMPSSPIYFGVLFFLGSAMLISLPFRKPMSKILPVIGIIVCFLLFLFSYDISKGNLVFGFLKLPDLLYSNMLTAFFGFPYPDFYSADYYSFFPWIFLFLCGFFLSSLLERAKQPPKFLYFKMPVFEWIGRRALIIYLAHQPILYGITLLIMKIKGV